MKVRLTAEVVSDDDALIHLYDILRFFESGRHHWIVDDIDAIERSKWVEKAGEPQAARILDLLRKTVTDAAYAAPTSTIEIEIGVEDGQLPPSSAHDVMSKPAYFIVEDATSDGRFVRALIHAYDNLRLELAIRERWLEIDHAGGKGQIPKRVHALIHERSADRKRIQALADSDRLYPGHESDTVRSMQALEREQAITVHVLHKRDSENYLPLDALAHHRRETSRFHRTYKAFCRLTPEQQDHFDMKSGFKIGPKGDAEPHPAQAELFDGVRPSVLRDLVGGFGEDCGCWFEDPQGTQGKTPHYVARATLEARCTTKPGELPAILARIEEML